MTRLVADACVTAHDSAKDRDPEFFVDAVYSFRRLNAEPALSKLVLPPGFVAKVKRETSTAHTEILSDRVTITALTRAELVTQVDAVKYRGSLVPMKQPFLPFMGGPSQETITSVYALLLYGGPHYERLPAFARIVFPDKLGWFLRGIDLLSEFPDIINSYKPATGAATAEPTLRKDAKEKGDDDK
ncbi:MAG: hypothetical protein ABJA82_16165 [Myxococcales bacterium]